VSPEVVTNEVEQQDPQVGLVNEDARIIAFRLVNVEYGSYLSSVALGPVDVLVFLNDTTNE
jgi:hypothetical protein